MSTLKLRRSAARGWVTRTSRKITDLISDVDKIDYIQLDDAIQEFDKRLNALDELQQEFELSIDSEETLSTEIDEAADFRENARKSRINSVKYLKRHLDPKDEDIKSNASVSAKLPKIILPEFSGDVKEWSSFWDQFEVAVDSTDLPCVAKFTYLLSLLKGDAKAAISGFSLSNKHYSEAVALLKRRFGRKERIIQSHIDGLLNINIAKQFKVSSLWELFDKLQGHVRSLAALDVTGDKYGVLLSPIILSRLPSELRLEWARKGEGHESDLDFLLKFLEEEIRSRERSELNITDKTSSNDKEQKKNVPTATVLQSTSSSTCSYCNKNHHTSKCWQLTKIPITDRIEKLKKKGLCFRCLGTNHLANSCDKKCSKCVSGDHHALICKKIVTTNSDTSNENKPNSTPAGGVSKAVSSTSVDVVSKSKVVCSTSGSRSALSVKSNITDIILQIVEVKVQGKNGMVYANVLFDTGADRSYVSSDLVDRVGPEFSRGDYLSYCSFGNNKHSGEFLRNVYNLKVFALNGPLNLEATEVENVCAPLCRRKIPDNVLGKIGSLRMTANYNVACEITIDILIGLDQYWKFVKPEVVPIDDNLSAQNTVFGWMLYGSVKSESQNNQCQSSSLLCIQGVNDRDLRKIWDVDLSCDSELDNKMVKTFEEENIAFKNGRYEVGLPWLNEDKKKSLMNNYGVAVKRLKSLQNKLDKNRQLRDSYNSVFYEMEKEHIIEEVKPSEIYSGNPVFYLPHRPVVRESSVSTKVRPVFDGSVRDGNGLSLNDCMMTGPNLIPDLIGILIKFRKWPVAIVADIKKAFLQISVKSEDCDVHRFLWEIDDKVRVMRFARVIFGNRASPFILNSCIKYHLKKYDHSQTIQELTENLYVDDWLSGAEDDNEANFMIDEATKVLADCGMLLTKWESNSKQVRDKTVGSMNTCPHSNDVKVLGVKWDPVSDNFGFVCKDLPINMVITKRLVLSLIARLFDPLGFVAPFSIKLKILFQNLWKSGYGWDAELPSEITSIVQAWVKDLEILNSWVVHRQYMSGCWRDIQFSQIVAFGDASEKAYGACVYLLTVDKYNVISSSLVLAKSRVVPLTKITLPRLELLGALLACQLAEVARKALKFDHSKCLFYSDSSVALGWIKGDVNRWKPFVANRVGQIQAISSPAAWKHCNGKENPADLLTRGICADDLINSTLWLHGPTFLIEQNQNINELAEVYVEPNVQELVSEEKTKLAVILTTIDIPVLFQVERYSTLLKAVRVVAWIKRFTDNCKNGPRRSGDLTVTELESAKSLLILKVQQQFFFNEMNELKNNKVVPKRSRLSKVPVYIDANGLLRVKGRLQFSQLSYEEKHPLVIPQCHLAVLLVRFQHVLSKHAGVTAMLTSLRSTYWILGARRIAKRVKKFCVICQKQDVKHAEQPEAPLHSSRVTKANPFSITGLDYAGPLYCSDHDGKLYILLFTCAIIRGVHLELVTSMGLGSTLLAIRRFVARKGLPNVIWSDNFKSFVAASKSLIHVYGTQTPKWNFIVPSSPWWGGWWERLVRSCKSALRKSLGRYCITYSELETLLYEVEGCINSRPITYVSDDIEGNVPLTPLSFLIGRTHIYEQGPVLESKLIRRDTLTSLKNEHEHMLNLFWHQWTHEYICNLPSANNSSLSSKLIEGSLVLIQDDSSKRNMWPLGIITKTFIGKDNVIRSCEVKTAKGLYLRPIQRLYHLELESDHELIPASDIANVAENDSPEVIVNDNTSVGDIEPKQSRYGRTFKKVNRLGV